MKSGIIIAFIFSLLFSFSHAYTQDEKPKTEKLVYKFNIKENIAPAIWRQTKQAFVAADSLKADLFLIHMNTYGGTVVDADSIRTRILNSKIPVVVFIDNNAASAGALISLACDSIYMRTGASMGAATVVNQTGEKMPDKYQSYMRATMRATAEAHGKDTIITVQDTTYKWKRDPQIAEAMVDERIYIPNIIDSGKILTFTPAEAMKNGYCEGICENMEEVLNVQSEINGIQEEIESAAGRINYLQHSSALSTINLTFYQVINATAKDSEKPSYSEKISDAFSVGWKWVGELFVVFVSIWPLLLMTFIVFLIYKKMKKPRVKQA